MELEFINKENAYLENHSVSQLSFSLNNDDKIISINNDSFKDAESLITTTTSHMSGIIAIINYESKIYYLHVKDKSVFITKYLNGHSDKSIDLDLDLLFEGYHLNKTKFSYEIVDQLGNNFELNHSLFIPGSNPVNYLIKKDNEEPNIYLKIQYSNLTSFLEYKINESSFLLRTLYVSVLYNDYDINLKMLSNNKFKINQLTNKSLTRSGIHKRGTITIKAPKEIKQFKPILIMMNNSAYILEYINKNKFKISHIKQKQNLVKDNNITCKSTSKGMLFKGNLKHTYNNMKVDSIVTKDNLKLAKIKWMDAENFSFLIEIKSLDKLVDIHSTIFVAYGKNIIYPLHFKRDYDGQIKILCFKNYEDKSFISRINLNNNFTLTSIPRSPIYSKTHQFKIKTAKFIAEFLKKTSSKNVNLYFEKDTNQANESGYVTFQAVKKHPDIHSVNKYILDGSNEMFAELKNKYGNDLIKRFSFKHYLYLFLASNFISSELSNHVLSTRVFNDLLTNKIVQTPLYFLQHGIMFAKPVDNPMALGFHKENQKNNLKKSVISSDLEAKEFYKMGYDDSDLMKTGLPKLDKAYMYPGAHKIAYMPTWRYWEEGSIVKGEIENTTYYKTLMNFIEIFKKANLLDRLLLVPHNKFAEYIKDNFKEYEKNISTNPTEALKESVIFITDYSSIIYDATYRGAYPIFYWKDKDYLIENYKAIPPVNEKNAPGRIAKTDHELIDYIKEAIENNYDLPKDVKEKFLKVNEFNDNRNTERVIETLRSLGVL